MRLHKAADAAQATAWGMQAGLLAACCSGLSRGLHGSNQAAVQFLAVATQSPCCTVAGQCHLVFAQARELKASVEARTTEARSKQVEIQAAEEQVRWDDISTSAAPEC
jgi:tRNA threonylcarbamoyladenosine modification (KEOPS) complex Cgi121 subunit